MDGAKKGVGGLGLLACLETEMLNIHGQGMQAQEGRGGEEIDRGRMEIIAWHPSLFTPQLARLFIAVHFAIVVIPLSQ